MNIYQDLLRAQWDDVSAKVRRSHLSGEALNATCCLDVAGSSSVVGRMISRIVGLPPSMKSAPVTLHIRSSPEGEIWQRMFPGCNLCSVQSRSREGYLIDRFRLIAFYFRLDIANGGILHKHMHTYLVFGSFHLRLPRFLAPEVASHEEPDPIEDASRITVSLSMPIAGHLLTYTGIVRPIKNT